MRSGQFQFTLVLSLVLIISTFAVSIAYTQTASAVGDPGLEYEFINDNTAAEVVGYSGSSDNVVIPSVYQGAPVVSIVGYAFQGQTTLASVIIPDSVRTIGDSAFAFCTSLTSITIPNSVTRIGSYAFSYCSFMTSVTIGTGVTSIDNAAFQGCSALKLVVIPDSVVSIKERAFTGCDALQSVTIGSGVTFIGEDAFSSDALTSVTFLGLTAPTTVASGWISGPSTLQGHAYASSNFPAPENKWNGLMMGANIAGIVDAQGKTPDPPIELSATPGNGYIYLNWSAPALDGGYPVTVYKVYRGVGSDSYSVIGIVNDSSYNDLSVENGVPYSYYVTAVNAIGESNQSMTVSASSTGSLSAPSAPENLTIATVDGKVSLNWSAPSLNGGSSVIDYKIYRGERANDLTLIATSATTHFTDASAITGKLYYYAITAVNGVGESGRSSSASILMNPDMSGGPSQREVAQSVLIIVVALLVIPTVEYVLLNRWRALELSGEKSWEVVGTFITFCMSGFTYMGTNFTNTLALCIGLFISALSIPFSWLALYFIAFRSR